MYWVLQPWEGHRIKEHVFRYWDIGARRTFWAYFAAEDCWKEAEQCLALYFFGFYDEATRAWTCRNPSAAAVHTIRRYSRLV